MRSWRSIAGTFVLMGGLLVLLAYPVWSQTAAQEDDDERDDISTLQTQVAALQTQVAELQTQVAGLQPTTAEATPETTAVACGRPFSNWGAGTSDNVEVQLLQVTDVDELPADIAGEAAIAIELVITNQSDSAVAYQLEDFEVADCSGQVATAIAGGPDPAIASGEIAPGDSLRGWVLFPLPAGAQAADFTYHIQSPNRTGAQVICPLVDREADPVALDQASGGAGCSAIGGSA